MKISCIYKIKSKVKPDRIYIGSAVDFVKRKKKHIRELSNDEHHNIRLLNHVKKYGISDLNFYIVERVYEKSSLILTEQFYINEYNPFFNICKVAGSSLGTKHTPKALLKMSVKRIIKNTENMGKANLGKHRTEETKNKIRLANLGRKYPPITEEIRDKLRVAAKNRPPITEVTREKIRNAKIGTKMSSEAISKSVEMKKFNKLLKTA